MSRAFTKESDREERMGVPPPPLPPGVPNYITAAGATRLRAERVRLGEERAGLRGVEDPGARERLAIIDERIALIEAREVTWVELAPGVDPPRVVFGCAIDIVGRDGRARTISLVGVDEVDASAGLVSFLSPLGRALVGAEVGDVVSVESPRGVEEVEVVAVRA